MSKDPAENKKDLYAKEKEAINTARDAIKDVIQANEGNISSKRLEQLNGIITNMDALIDNADDPVKTRPGLNRPTTKDLDARQEKSRLSTKKQIVGIAADKIEEILSDKGVIQEALDNFLPSKPEKYENIINVIKAANKVIEANGSAESLEKLEQAKENAGVKRTGAPQQTQLPQEQQSQQTPPSQEQPSPEQQPRPEQQNLNSASQANANAAEQNAPSQSTPAQASQNAGNNKSMSEEDLKKLTELENTLNNAKDVVQQVFHDNSPALKEALGKEGFKEVKEMVGGMGHILTDPQYSKGQTLQASLEMKAVVLNMTIDMINDTINDRAEKVKQAKQVAKDSNSEKENNTVTKLKTTIKAAAKVVKTSLKVATTSKEDENYNLYKQQSQMAKLKLSAAQFSTTKSAKQLEKLAEKVETAKGKVSDTLQTQRANIDKARGGSGRG